MIGWLLALLRRRPLVDAWDAALFELETEDWS